MRRTIPSRHEGEVTEPLWLDPTPAELRFSLSESLNRCQLQPSVSVDDQVGVGAPIAQSDPLIMHSPISGIVSSIDDGDIVLKFEERGADGSDLKPNRALGKDGLVDFARKMGLVGLGGSMFPASIKLKAASGVDTLVINAVECEPGIQIDEALLLYEGDDVRLGINCLTEALGIKRTVLAVKGTSASHLTEFAQREKIELLRMKSQYPAGAEKLIVARLTHRMPPAGVFPTQLGILVFSVASLWAIGRRLRLGEPVIWRPLTLVVPGQSSRNLIVPVGTPLQHLLSVYGVDFDPARHLLITGGLMMGAQAQPESPITKGTNAVFVKPITARLAKTEDPCIECGACFDACPLGLHPTGMVDRIKVGLTSRALSAQLRECFLCGACSAVCPSDIPLAQYFRDAKAKEQK